MHDTAHRIGGLVIDTYLPSVPTRILEIGALNVNGTLRDHSPRDAEYTGLDFDSGGGVDIVITGLDDWNVPDAHFDLVIASSVFEHDITFWQTFLAMCRKTRPGGHIYVNAPSNGTIHRYPRDCWRFYPDAGLALEEWARSEAFDITLVESFVAEREGEGWNDFCAVFRVGPCNDELNRDFVYDKVHATNARNWQSSLTMNAQDDPEDTRLLRAAYEGQLAAREQERARFETEKSRLLAVHTEEIEARMKEISELADEIERQKAELAGQKSVSEQRLQERFREIAGLSRVILERDQVIAAERARAEWLRQVVSVLTWGHSKSPKARLTTWLPTYFNHKRQKSRLKQQGLFDPDAYTALYPDVSRSGADPLRHYINHGIKEGRIIRNGS